MSNLLTEQISHDDLRKYLKAFYKYAKKLLNLERAPRLFLINDQENADNFIGKTGYYDPQKEEVYLYITDRHAKDIVRSFAHELIHHLQKLNGITDKLDLSKTSSDPAYSLHDDLLRQIEIEAFRDGNMAFRDWTDKLKIGLITVIAENKNVINEATFEDKVEAIIKSLKKSGKKKGLRKSAKRIAGAMIRDEKKTQKENKAMKMTIIKKSVDQQEMMKEAEDDETQEISDFRPVGRGDEGPEGTEENPLLRSKEKDTNVSLTAQDKIDQMAVERTRKLEDLAHNIKKHYSNISVPSEQVSMFFDNNIQKYKSIGMDKWWERLKSEVIARRSAEERGSQEKLGSEISSEIDDRRRIKGLKSLTDIAGDPLKESKKTPYPVLFEQRERLLKEAYQTREERVYAELVRRFIKK
jgi:hypothetical protein